MTAARAEMPLRLVLKTNVAPVNTCAKTEIHQKDVDAPILSAD
jgi:hypothetical protein